MIDVGKCTTDETNSSQGPDENITKGDLIVADEKNNDKSRKLSCRIVPINRDMNMATVIHIGYVQYICDSIPTRLS